MPPSSAKTSSNLKILFIASECFPFAKAGGLGDVVPALAKELHEQEHEVRVVIPLYKCISHEKYKLTFVKSCCVHMGNGIEHWVGIYESKIDGKVPIYFVDFKAYFDRDGIYDNKFYGYQDNPHRFALLCKAAIQFCKDIRFYPDIAHMHDWPSAMGAVFLKTWDLFNSPMSKTASVLTIHNIGYQGCFDAHAYDYFGVGQNHFNADCLEDHGRINLLKGGICFADAITTVSPTHAQEILGSPGGNGLEFMLQKKRESVFGILNGADYDQWNSETDKTLASNFSSKDLRGKAECKRALQEQLHMKQDPTLPIFGLVTRFVPQKGLGFIIQTMEKIIQNMEIQIAVLGTGDHDTESFFNYLKYKYPERVGVYIGYSEEISHHIMAGSDFFMMPSLYEPCGLTQMYALRYGSLPVVRATGGLEDSVQNYDEKTGNGTGFKFYDPNSDAFYYTMGWATSTWYDRPKHYLKLQQQAMHQDFSWEDATCKYLAVYQHAIKNRRGE